MRLQKWLLKEANVSPEEIDLIILATDTPEFLSPATSAAVHYGLGTKKASFFDINSACAGFVMALDTASKHMIADSYLNTILVIGAYNMTKYVDWKDKKTCTIFADGAAAFVLRAQDSEFSRGRLASSYLGVSEYYDALGIFAGGTRMPITKEVLESGKNLHKVKFLKKFSPQLNIENWPFLVEDCLKKAKISKQDVKHYIFTQININATREVMKVLGEPMEKTTTIMDKYGYTGSACVPMAYHLYKQKEAVQEGDVIVFCASGGGMSMCAYLYKH